MNDLVKSKPRKKYKIPCRNFDDCGNMCERTFQVRVGGFLCYDCKRKFVNIYSQILRKRAYLDRLNTKREEVMAWLIEHEL